MVQDATGSCHSGAGCRQQRYSGAHHVWRAELEHQGAACQLVLQAWRVWQGSRRGLEGEVQR